MCTKTDTGVYVYPTTTETVYDYVYNYIVKTDAEAPCTSTFACTSTNAGVHQENLYRRPKARVRLRPRRPTEPIPSRPYGSKVYRRVDAMTDRMCVVCMKCSCVI